MKRNKSLYKWSDSDLIAKDSCMVCGGKDFKRLAIRQDGLAIEICGDCQLGMVNPCPTAEALHKFYNDGYFSGNHTFFENSNYCISRNNAVLKGIPVTGYSEIINHINVAGKRILDIGCGSGALLKMLSSRGAASLTGIDVYREPVEFGLNAYGLDLRCVDLKAAMFAPKSFDLVLLVDVLEHVPDPVETMQEIERILDDEGTVFVYTPNLDSFEKVQNLWSQLHSCYEHLHYFNKKSLDALCQKACMNIDEYWTSGLPIILKSYGERPPSLFKKLMSPRTALFNAWVRIKYKGLESIGCGQSICAVLRKKRGGLPCAG